MNTEEMKGRILGVLGALGAREPMSSGSIALRLGIDWRSNPTVYERVGKTLAKLKKAGSVVLERGKGWRLSDASTSATKVHHAMKKSPAQLDYEIAEAMWQPVDLGFEAGFKAGEEQACHDVTPRETLRQLRTHARTDFERGLVAGYESICSSKAAHHATRKQATPRFPETELRGEIVPLPSASGRTARSQASRPDRNIIVRPTSTRWPGGVKVRVVKFGADVRQGVRAVMPVGSLAVMHPDAGERLPDGTVRVHEDELRDTAD